MIIDMRKAVLLLPIYVAWMVGTDLLFNSSGVNASNDLPLWLIIGFTIMAVLVVLIVAWYLVQRSRGTVPPKRERVYMGFLDLPQHVHLDSDPFLHSLLRDIAGGDGCRHKPSYDQTR